MILILKTSRLKLRRWLPQDETVFAAINADAKVMEHFPQPFSYQESCEQIKRFNQSIDENGFGFFACELIATGELIGMVGLSRPRFEAHFTPCVEIGWRLAEKFWGQGLAFEAAKEVLRFGFEQIDLPEIVAFTVVANQRSRALMQRLGMKHDPTDDFAMPTLRIDHRCSAHVLYRLSGTTRLSSFDLIEGSSILDSLVKPENDS